MNKWNVQKKKCTPAKTDAIHGIAFGCVAVHGHGVAVTTTSFRTFGCITIFIACAHCSLFSLSLSISVPLSLATCAPLNDLLVRPDTTATRPTLVFIKNLIFQEFRTNSCWRCTVVRSVDRSFWARLTDAMLCVRSLIYVLHSNLTHDARRNGIYMHYADNRCWPEWQRSQFVTI